MGHSNGITLNYILTCEDFVIIPFLFVNVFFSTLLVISVITALLFTSISPEHLQELDNRNITRL